MIRALLPSLLALASVAALARAPRFLGPPVKKPADAGPCDASDGGAAADAGAAHGQAEPAILKVGDDGPIFAGVLPDR